MIASLIPAWSPHMLDVLIAVGAVGAVIVAVLGGLFRAARGRWSALRSRPSMTIEYDVATDLQTEAVVTVVAPGVQSAPRPAAYARLRVIKARGRRAAEGARVIVSSLEGHEKRAAVRFDAYLADAR